MHSQNGLPSVNALGACKSDNERIAALVTANAELERRLARRGPLLLPLLHLGVLISLVAILGILATTMSDIATSLHRLARSNSSSVRRTLWHEPAPVPAFPADERGGK